METTSEVRLKRLMQWRKFELDAPYPETAQPQNDMVLRACAGRENTFEYRHTEAQGGN